MTIAPEFLITCPECKGEGQLYYIERPSLSAAALRPGDDVPVSFTMTRELRVCQRCLGSRCVPATERIPVLQFGARIGTLPPNFDPMRIKSLNVFYSPRPDDFVREGNAWVASRHLGPGDLEAVAGFAWEDPQE